MDVSQFLVALCPVYRFREWVVKFGTQNVGLECVSCIGV